MRKGVDQLREERALHASVLRAHEEHRIAHHRGAERTAMLRRKLEILDRAIADAEAGRATAEGGEAPGGVSWLAMHEIAQAAHLEDQPCGALLDPADPVLGEFTLLMREDGRLMLKSGPIQVVEPDGGD